MMGISSSLTVNDHSDLFPWHAFTNRPKMLVLREQTNRNRKTMCILNDNAKNRLSQYNTMLSRERCNATFQFCNMTGPIKQTLYRKRITQRCLQRLKSRAIDTKPKERYLGRYQGVSLDDMNAEVDDVIADLHPACRRMRRVKRLLNKDKENKEAMEERTNVLMQKMTLACVPRDRTTQMFNAKCSVPKAPLSRSSSDMHKWAGTFKNIRPIMLPPLPHDNMKHDQGRLRKPDQTSVNPTAEFR